MPGRIEVATRTWDVSSVALFSAASWPRLDGTCACSRLALQLTWCLSTSREVAMCGRRYRRRA